MTDENKIEICSKRINELVAENEKLKAENEWLKARNKKYAQVLDMVVDRDIEMRAEIERLKTANEELASKVILADKNKEMPNMISFTMADLLKEMRGL